MHMPSAEMPMRFPRRHQHHLASALVELLVDDEARVGARMLFWLTF